MECWAFLDKIYCISLEHRQDRREYAQREFHKVGLQDRVEFVPAELCPHDSEKGIYASHMRCIEMGLQSGASHIAIFEDDVVFDRFDSIRLASGFQYLHHLPQWEAFFLGCLVYRSLPTDSPGVLRVRYRSLAHAYVLNRPFAEKMITIPWSDKPFDVMLRDALQNAYAIYPAVAFQSNAASDNDRLKGLDRFRRFCGGLRFIQMMNERCHRHVKAIILIHLLAALALAGGLLLVN